MRLQIGMGRGSRKTWSQQVLEIKQPPAPSRGQRLLSYEKRAMLLLAVKTALAAGLCYWLATLAHLQDGYWGSISAIIVLQSNVGSTVTASRDRLLGTLIGAAFGGAFSLVGEELWVYLLAVVLAMITCSLLGLKNSSRLAGVTVTIIMLVHRGVSNWTLPLHRVMEVLLGIVIALAFSALVFPSRARLRLRDGLAQEYLLLGALFEAVMASFRGLDAEHLPRLRKDVEAIQAANGQLLDAARNEPTGGPASLESLSLLCQFGKGLQEIVHALELAVGTTDTESGETLAGYAAQLDPELEQLAADIQESFLFVARCIHGWKFERDPKGIELEADITALEAKMAAIRPLGLEFPQAEILRAYAVQLHLKQLARLLNTSRLQIVEAAV